MNDNLDPAAWIGRREVADDVVSPIARDRFAATIGGSSAIFAETMRNPLACWLFFLPCAAQSDLGNDGHPRKGGFLPPLKLPRRMWAGSSLRFHAPLENGRKISRTSTIANVQNKEGRSGRLAFVTIDHEIRARTGLLVSEQQTIVYRDHPRTEPSAVAAVPPTIRPDRHDWTVRIVPDSALLMRYSALTFNAHKIHYDRGYATAVEGYPGLVVHGPLLATLLMNLYLVENPSADVVAFDFKAVAPIFDTAPFGLYGARTNDGAKLWATDAAGSVCLRATVWAR
ncbi:FAS1-like dehydratase domain-containing protein [Specibacter cremeus]|uniref:FAS1-like dehydratase domain-containing protein n=1 Tax=Specibacter cremeus TaxID=1629051 RepID=UPI000F7A5C68|nr:MaoC family dehydratase N-terminal domain-containing protein [Specibacter cremeus]